MLYSINRQNVIVCLPLILELLGNMCIAIVCFQVVMSLNLKLPYFSNQAIVLYEQKVKSKI